MGAMTSTMASKFAELERIRRVESDLKDKFLALCFSKSIEQLADIPEDWSNCLCVEMDAGDALWLDAERCLMPMLNNLIGSMAHKGKEPIDVCIVRRKLDGSNYFSVVVRTIG